MNPLRAFHVRRLQCTLEWGSFAFAAPNQASDTRGARNGFSGTTDIATNRVTFPSSGRLPFEKLDRARNDDYDIPKEGPQTRAAAAVPGRGRVSLFSHHHARSIGAGFNLLWSI
jgi:hypothetical protein